VHSTCVKPPWGFRRTSGAHLARVVGRRLSLKDFIGPTARGTFVTTDAKRVGPHPDISSYDSVCTDRCAPFENGFYHSHNTPAVYLDREDKRARALGQISTMPSMSAASAPVFGAKAAVRHSSRISLPTPRSNVNILPCRRAVCTMAATKLEVGVQSKVTPTRTVVEDYYSIKSDDRNGLFFAVYDGHGGPDAARWLDKKLWDYIKGKVPWEQEPRRVANALKRAFLDFDNEMNEYTKAGGLFKALAERGVGGSRCGSTATTVIIPAGQGSRLICANVGDSRTLLIRRGKAVPLTRDHNPEDKQERDRLTVLNERLGEGISAPVTQDAKGIWRVKGQLAITRTFGDFFVKRYCNAEPDVVEEKLTGNDEYILLASDGVWEVMANQEAVDVIMKNKSNLQKAANALVDTAYAREPGDDITVLVAKVPRGGF